MNRLVFSLGFVVCFSVFAPNVGVTKVADQGPRFTSIESNGFSACAIRESDQKVQCWGEDIRGAAVPPADLGQVISLVKGKSCAVKADRTLGCWGDAVKAEGERLRFEVGGEEEFVEMAYRIPPDFNALRWVGAGIRYICGLTVDGVVKCFTRTDEKGRADPFASGYYVTQIPEALGKVDSLATGSDTACAIRTEDKKLFCWGGSSGTVDGKESPLRAGLLINAAQKYKQVFMGWGTVCAERLLGGVDCWRFGGLTLKITKLDIFSKLTQVKQMSLSGDRACAIKDGDTEKGDLVCESTEELLSVDELAVFPRMKARSVSADRDAICAVDENGIAVCRSQQSNQKTAAIEMTPDRVAGIQEIKGSMAYWCAKWKDGKFGCWGELDTYGYVDNNGYDIEPVAQPNFDQDEVVSFDVATSHACVIFKKKGLACWGLDVYKQISAPFIAKSGITKVVTGGEATCVLKKKNNMPICFGAEDDEDEVYKRDYTVEAPGGLSLDQIAIGDSNHICGRRTRDHKVVCWGNNSVGQASPTEGLGPVASVSTGSGHSCSLDTFGEIECWGGSFLERYPKPDDLSKDIVAFETRYSRACALNGNSELRCWGSPGPGIAKTPDDLGPVEWFDIIDSGVCAHQIEEDHLRCWGGLVI